jgi:Fe-S-cluster containining protein
MNFDFKPYFARYEQLAMAADGVFERVRREYPDRVRCQQACADCCHALFDLTLIEALYLHHRFQERFPPEERETLLEMANRADRQIHKLKREAYREFTAGRSEEEILEALAAEKVRCPLLNANGLCDLYDHRPITCRLYGVPTAIGGKGRTCALSGFEAGKTYPTVQIDRLVGQLQAISAELVRDLGAANIRLADILMPLSMALLTEFDEEFWGLEGSANPDAADKGD